MKGHKKHNNKHRLVVALVSILVVILPVFLLTSCSTNNSLSNDTNESDVTVSVDFANYNEGIKLYDKEEYISAMEYFMRISPDSNQYDKAQTMLLKCKDEYCVKIVEKANKYAKNGEYEVALNLLNDAKDILQDHSSFITAYDNIFVKYKEVVCNKAFSEADAFISIEDYPSAITAIDNALALVNNDEELSARRMAYIDAYVFQTISLANTQYIEYNYDSILAAESTIESALRVLPNNETLLSKLDYYKALEPAKLLDLARSPGLSQTVSTIEFEYVSNKTDIAGNTYSIAISPSYWFENSHPYGWSETYSSARYSWLLDYQYKKVTGKIFFSGDYKNASIEIELIITPSVGKPQTYFISNNSQAKYFEVDLTGAKDFEIYLKQSEINGTYAYLSDVYIWK